MNFETSRAKALDKLDNFIENNLSEYSKLRNFDFGPKNRSNTIKTYSIFCDYIVRNLQECCLLHTVRTNLHFNLFL